MSSLLQKALQLLVGDPDANDFTHVPKKDKRPLKQLTERELIKLESDIGSLVFGPIPEGHVRQFFCLDKDTWIWYEEWTEKGRKKQSTTVRYEVHDKGIFKVQDGARYSYLEGEELRNFTMAVKLYYEQVARKIYKIDPATGKKLV